MIDTAAMRMGKGEKCVAERICGVDDNMVQPHFHPFIELYYLRKGQRVFVLDDTECAVNSGDIVVMPPFFMHYSYGHRQVPFDRIVMYLQPEELTEPALRERIMNMRGLYTLNTTQLRHNIDASLLKLCECSDGTPFQDTYSRSLGNLICAEVASHAQNVTDRARRGSCAEQVRAYIYKHYAEDLSLDRLSEMFNVSKFHLSREFKKLTHETLYRYVNMVRVINAQRLFLETDSTLTAIAAATGFSSLTHFEKVFVRLAGSRPKECQLQYRRLRASKKR